MGLPQRTWLSKRRSWLCFRMLPASPSICTACRLSTSGSSSPGRGASEVNKKDHDIIATWGPDPDKNDEFGLGCVVFGGVVRGDKATGLLANARVRLLKNQVVIAWALSEL